jgi:hypothetical protein
MPATEFFRLRASLRLLQDRNDLFFGKPFALHGLLLMKQTLLPFGTNLGCQVVHGLLLMKQTLLPFGTNLGCQVGDPSGSAWSSATRIGAHGAIADTGYALEPANAGTCPHPDAVARNGRRLGGWKRQDCHWYRM